MSSDVARRGHVFVVWGGNQDLALLVARRLSEKGIHAEAGGAESGRANSIFLGHSIFEQMRRAAAVVILVQFREGVESQASQLSQNLMIEWGYAARHVGSPPLLMPILIGVAEENLPSDFRGVWAERFLDTESLETSAEKISQHVSDAIDAAGKTDKFSPGNLVRNWHDERYQLEKLLRHDSVLLEVWVRQLMGTLFVPLSSNKEVHLIEMLKEERATKVFGHLPEYRILLHALQYETAMGLQGSEAQAAFSSIYRGLAGLKDYEFISRWPLVLKYNFMGLALRKTASLCASDTERATLRDKARRHYQDGISMLEEAVTEHQPSNLCINIWRSFLLRNLGKIEEESNNKDTAAEALSAAVSARNSVYSEIAGLNAPGRSAANALFELVLAEMDLAELTGSVSHTQIAEALALAEAYLRKDAETVSRIVRQIEKMKVQMPYELEAALGKFNILLQNK